MGADIKINSHNPVEVRRILEAIYNDLTAIAANLATRKTDAIINATVLAIGSTTHQHSTTAFQYAIDGVTYTKAAAATTAFTTANTINTGAAAGLFWGAWRLAVNASGTIVSTSAGADQVYTTEALAIAALPDATAGLVSIGYITVQANTGATWTMNTDDLVAGSDCNDVNFYSDSAFSDITLETLND